MLVISLQSWVSPHVRNGRKKSIKPMLIEHNANAPESVKITYSLRDHLRETAIDHPRFGLALILHAARGRDAEKVWSIVKKLCDEYDAFRRSQAITPEQQIEERLFAVTGKYLNFDY